MSSVVLVVLIVDESVSEVEAAVVSPVVTVESVDSVFASSAETLLSFRTTELPKIKLATRTDPAVFHFYDFLMA